MSTLSGIQHQQLQKDGIRGLSRIYLAFAKMHFATKFLFGKIQSSNSQVLIN